MPSRGSSCSRPWPNRALDGTVNLNAVPSRREFIHRTLWAALALWAAPTGLWAADTATHVVARGDTLGEIARRYGTTVKELQRLNKLRGPVIKVGQRLTVPLAAARGDLVEHLVTKGETLGLIAAHYGSTVEGIKSANHLRTDLIAAGQVLQVPLAPPIAARSSPVAGDAALLAPVIQATRKIRVDPDRWRYIVCHHSAIEDGNATIYGNEHKRRGMENGLAYHFVIGNGRDSGNGQIEIGPRWEKQLRGGHVRSTKVNDTGIGICLVGNLENHPPTRLQQQALDALLGFLRDGHVHRTATLTVHKWVDRAHTLCPGRHFNYDGLKRFA